jgi:outer membrane protein assembly factor BamB
MFQLHFRDASYSCGRRKSRQQNVDNNQSQGVYMHNIKQEPSQDDSAVKKLELPASEESSSQLFQGRVVVTKQLKVPRNWRYMLAGGTVLLVFVVVLADVLFSRSQPLKQLAHSRSIPVSASTAIPRSIPIPAANPINSPVWMDHNVSVTVVDGVTYAGTADNAVYALRSSNGLMLWHTKIDGAVEESPVVVNGIVYVGSFVGQYGPAYFSALRASDGTVLWRYSSNSYIYAPTIGDGIVYIASQGNDITALRASDGTSLWHFTAPPGSGYQITSLLNGVLYVNVGADGQSGSVYALRASNGTVLWRYTTDGFVNMFMSPNEVVYVFSQNKLSALRAGDGHQLWSRAIDITFDQSPQIIDGVIYFMATKVSLETPTASYSTSLLPQAMDIGTLLWGHGQTATSLKTVPLKATVPLKEGKSTMYAIRAGDGTMLWQYPMNNGGDSFSGWLQVQNGVVYTNVIVPGNNDNTGYIAALQSSDGKVLWQNKVDGSPSGMLLTGGMIYTSVEAANVSAVYALRADNGTFVWHYPVNGTLFTDPVLVNTTVYIGAGNGIVYALRADNGALVWHYLTDVGS